MVGSVCETNPRFRRHRAARRKPIQRVGQQERASDGHRGRSVAEHEKCTNEPEAGRWPGMRNGFWELRLDRRMPTIGHLTTWPDLEEVRRTRDGRGIRRNEPSAAPRRRSGCRSAKRTQRSGRRDGGRFAKRTQTRRVPRTPCRSDCLCRARVLCVDSVGRIGSSSRRSRLVCSRSVMEPLSRPRTRQTVSRVSVCRQTAALTIRSMCRRPYLGTIPIRLK